MVTIDVPRYSLRRRERPLRAATEIPEMRRGRPVIIAGIIFAVHLLAVIWAAAIGDLMKGEISPSGSAEFTKPHG